MTENLCLAFLLTISKKITGIEGVNEVNVIDLGLVLVDSLSCERTGFFVL